MGTIRVLPGHLVNQIAAGEVVERPASVVKELCENSLDAGAKAIHVELVEGGIRRILVADDGSGMSREDALTCLERHATSKLADAEGLQRIATLGFRGEAVPAIASVSRFSLTTREGAAEEATRIVVEGGTVQRIEAAGAPAGTTIVVEDLFFNTPARRKFLKRADTEAAHASEAVVRLALARPAVGFTLVSGSRTTFTSPASPSDPRERIAAALGADVFDHLIEVDEAHGGTRVHGFVASPDYTVSTSRSIHTFVNGRFVRDRALLAAVQRGFADALMPGRQPAAVLFLQMPLEQVDVNVHPQKLEVRFADQRATFDAVVRALRGALRRSPWLAAKTQEAAPVAAEEPSAYSPAPVWTPAPIPFSFARVPVAPAVGVSPPAASGPNEPVQAAEPTEPRVSGQPPAGFFRSLRVIGQFARTYIVCEGPGPQLVVIDQHAAHERLAIPPASRGLPVAPTAAPGLSHSGFGRAADRRCARARRPSRGRARDRVRRRTLRRDDVCAQGRSRASRRL